jgi:hypothetical protein
MPDNPANEILVQRIDATIVALEQQAKHPECEHSLKGVCAFHMGNTAAHADSLRLQREIYRAVSHLLDRPFMSVEELEKRFRSYDHMRLEFDSLRSTAAVQGASIDNLHAISRTLAEQIKPVAEWHRASVARARRAVKIATHVLQVCLAALAVGVGAWVIRTVKAGASTPPPHPAASAHP